MILDDTADSATLDDATPVELTRTGYWGAVSTSFQHTLALLWRHKWSLMGIVVAFLPVLIPLLMTFLDDAPTVPRGIDIFTQLTEKLYLLVIVPLFALFFGCMLIADDVESHTMMYILTRPVPRSAAVLGRFLAYLLFLSAILVSSLAFTFAASTTLGTFALNGGSLRLLVHYSGAMIMAVSAYGAMSMCLGAIFSKRPVVYGIAFVFGWQRLAMALPGYLDFITIEKYINAILPPLANQRDNPALRTAIVEFQKAEYIVGAGKSTVLLVLITLAFLALTAFIIRTREFTPGNASGA